MLRRRGMTNQFTLQKWIQFEEQDTVRLNKVSAYYSLMAVIFVQKQTID